MLMDVVEMLSQTREGWLGRISHRLARGAGVRESFLEQLNQLYDAFQHAVESGDPTWLEPTLNSWVKSLTQSELTDEDSGLVAILNEILILTYQYLEETLAAEKSNVVMNALLPNFTYAIEYTSRQETQARIDHISKELQIAQKTLERLDKSKSDFISVAAHELKTPLTLLDGYTSMLRDLFPKDDEMSQAVLLLKGIDNGTRRLREIVDDMIDVSLIDNNLLALNFQPIWLNQVLEALCEELDTTINNRQLSLDIKEFPGLHEMTFGDPERLYQAFRNLLTNAIKYTPDNGVITVDGKVLPGFIKVKIKDTGIGIDSEDHTRIFQKFGQLGNISLHSSGKTKFKGGGPGLGLPITKGIIEAHGGSIWVESEGYDEEIFPGSTFHVMLPIRKSPPDEKTTALYKSIVETEL